MAAPQLQGGARAPRAGKWVRMAASQAPVRDGAGSSGYKLCRLAGLGIVLRFFPPPTPKRVTRQRTAAIPLAAPPLTSEPAGRDRQAGFDKGGRESAEQEFIRGFDSIQPG